MKVTWNRKTKNRRSQILPKEPQSGDCACPPGSSGWRKLNTGELLQNKSKKQRLDQKRENVSGCCTQEDRTIA